MSSGARWTLGIATFLFGCGFAAMYDTIPQNKWMALVLAAICWLISFACTPLKGAGLAGRIIAVIVFLTTLGCVIAMAIQFNSNPTLETLKGNRSDSSLVNSLILFATWGLPAGIYAVSGIWTRRRARSGSLKTAKEEAESIAELPTGDGGGAW